MRRLPRAPQVPSPRKALIRARDPLKFNENGRLFIRTHNETLPVVAMATLSRRNSATNCEGPRFTVPVVRRAGRNQQRNRIRKVSQPIASGSVGICRRSTSRAAYLRTLFVRQSAANMRHITTANTRLSGRSKRSVTSSVGLFAKAWMPTHNIRLSLRA